jgi:protein SCO1/2
VRRTAVLLAVVAALAAAAAHAAPERPSALRDVAYDQRLGTRVPADLVFRDEQGAPVRLGDTFAGRPVLLVPAYYECPMLCTLVLSGVVGALRALPFEVGRELTVVTFSFDPAETPELAAAKKARVLGSYGRPEAAAGWHFLTGDEEPIRRLTEAIGFRYARDPTGREWAHAAGIVVLTPDGTIARYFYGVEFAPRDLRLALVEASANRIGSLVDQVLLFCFHYDPATGRYSRLAIDAIRVGGALTLAALAGGIALMLRRDRARPA